MAIYNRIFTQDKWNEVNKFNKQLLNDYIMQIKSDGKTESSIKQYFNDARIILIYIMEEHGNKELYRLTSKSFRNFKLWCQDNGMSTSRINRLLVTCRNLMNFGLEDDEFEEDFDGCKMNPSRLKGVAKEERRKIVFLDDSEVMAIYNRLMNDKKYSQALLCALMYDSACRRNEAFQVNVNDISVDGKITVSEVTGKRKKKFRLIYNQLTRDAYSKLIEYKNPKDSIWLTISDTPASYETLYNWVCEWREILKEETGIDKEFNPHSFRHSCLENLSDGTHYIARGLGKKFTLQELKLIANHENVATTEGYLKDKSEDKLMEAFGL